MRPKNVSLRNQPKILEPIMGSYASTSPWRTTGFLQGLAVWMGVGRGGHTSRCCRSPCGFLFGPILDTRLKPQPVCSHFGGHANDFAGAISKKLRHCINRGSNTCRIIILNRRSTTSLTQNITILLSYTNEELLYTKHCKYICRYQGNCTMP